VFVICVVTNMIDRYIDLSFVRERLKGGRVVSGASPRKKGESKPLSRADLGQGCR
jgi:hypothetical protein